MTNNSRMIQEVFAQANVTLNGNNPWDIIVNDNHFYSRLLNNTKLSIGETYVEGLWDCAKIDSFIYRVLTADLASKALAHPKFWRSALKQRFYDYIHNLFNHQTETKSFIVGKQHYDIGNDIYQAMLDKRMVYSCGYWEGAKTLDEAQELKLKLICEKLDLKPGMTVLDIGCGWGSFAKYAAENYKVSVLGITISKQQYEYAKNACANLPIEIRFQDYRELLQKKEQFNRIVSIGMFEHVGFKNYPIYMNTVSHCMKEDGLFLLHTIGANSSKYVSNSWLNKYIFPNSHLPTITQLASSFESIFIMEDWQNIGFNYDKTLMAWHHNFNNQWDNLKHRYNEQFRRMWNFYLLSCAGAFRARHNQVWQILLSKKGLPSGYSPVLIVKNTN
ncbi:MAG: cyclopropane fatty acyl phospholipid synthase [Proteobacteria bacterium]|nr:cyclopropane fatty acyl phospholipid synthase [Pseudomonadota bacterium]